MSVFDELRIVIEPALAEWVQSQIDREVCPLKRELEELRAATAKSTDPIPLSPSPSLEPLEEV